MLKTFECDEYLDFYAYDQSWTDEDKEELRTKYNIFFGTASGTGAVLPLMIFKETYTTWNNKEYTHYVCVVGTEDDGTIRFHKEDNGRFVNSFDAAWLESFIADLSAAKDFVEAEK